MQTGEQRCKQNKQGRQVTKTMKYSQLNNEIQMSYTANKNILTIHNTNDRFETI